MDKDKLKELVLKYLAELLDETSATGNAGGYLTKAFARKPTSQDKNAPAGFETMPKSGNVYKKMGFRIVKPNERIDAKDLWKEEHLEERIGYATPKAFKKPKKQHETSKSGHEDLPNPDKYFELVKFKIVDPEKSPKKKEEQLNEVRYSQFKKETKTRSYQEQLHIGVKKIQQTLDEVNKLVEFTSRMKTELKGDTDQMNYLKRTHNALFKINEKIQSINEKIKGLTE
jgi:vacuolar-type H+-ATPase subunit I/STV1